MKRNIIFHETTVDNDCVSFSLIMLFRRTCLLFLTIFLTSFDIKKNNHAISIDNPVDIFFKEIFTI
jgi:hypothetical protein